MMKKRKIFAEVTEYSSRRELTDDERTLISAAEGAALLSWSPYSKFSVGAAILMSNGEIVKGCNIENAAFPSGICAEHNAVSTAVTTHPGHSPVAIAIAALKGGTITSSPVTPCGKCRQVIAEEEKRCGSSIKIIMAGKERVIAVDSATDLLPLYFSGSDIPPAV